MRMSVPTCPKEDAKYALGQLLMWLRTGSKVSRITELADMSGMKRKNIRDIEHARGEYSEREIRALLPHLSAVTRFNKMPEIEKHLQVIYHSDQKQDSLAASVVEPSSLELAFVG